MGVNPFSMDTAQVQRACAAARKFVRENYISIGLNPDLTESCAVVDPDEPLLTKHYYRHIERTQTSLEQRTDTKQSDKVLKNLLDGEAKPVQAKIESVAYLNMKNSRSQPGQHILK